MLEFFNHTILFSSYNWFLSFFILNDDGQLAIEHLISDLIPFFFLRNPRNSSIQKVLKIRSLARSIEGGTSILLKELIVTLFVHNRHKLRFLWRVLALGSGIWNHSWSLGPKGRSRQSIRGIRSFKVISSDLYWLRLLQGISRLHKTVFAIFIIFVRLAQALKWRLHKRSSLGILVWMNPISRASCRHLTFSSSFFLSFRNNERCFPFLYPRLVFRYEWLWLWLILIFLLLKLISKRF